MATRSAERETVAPAGPADDADAIRGEMRVVVDRLVSTLEVERQLRRNVLVRMRGEVDRGDRMMVQLGIALPPHAG